MTKSIYPIGELQKSLGRVVGLMSVGGRREEIENIIQTRLAEAKEYWRRGLLSNREFEELQKFSAELK